MQWNVTGQLSEVMKNPLPDIMRTHIIIPKPSMLDSDWNEVTKLFAILGGMVVGFILRGIIC